LKEPDKLVLLEIYEKTSANCFLSIYGLNETLGISIFMIRNIVENLKSKGFVLEPEEDYFEISDKGLNFCKTQWL